MKKVVTIYLVVSATLFGYFGYQIKLLKEPILFATIPNITALFETSLQSSITSTAATATLVKGTDKEGTSLTGTIGFVIDEGTSDEEFVTCSASGTALTSCTRGISVTQPASSSAALKKSHRRGASVKITNYPQLAILSRILNGTDTIPNILNYNSPPTFTASRSIITKKYADDLVITGCVNIDETTKGCGELATVAEVNAGTGLGGTGARLLINPSYLASSNYGLNIPTAGQKAALPGSLGTPSSTNKYITQQDVSSSSFAPNASRSDWIIRSDGDSVPSGLWIDITKLNVTASASGDIIFHNGTSFTNLAKGAANQVLQMNIAGTFPVWRSSSVSFAFDLADRTAAAGSGLASASTTFKPRMVILYCSGLADNSTNGHAGFGISDGSTQATVFQDSAAFPASNTTQNCQSTAWTITTRNYSSTGFTINYSAAGANNLKLIWIAIK